MVYVWTVDELIANNMYNECFAQRSKDLPA